MARPRTMVLVLVGITLALALAGCELTTAPSAADDAASPAPSRSAGASPAGADLSAIACGTDDPADVGELTGAWAGSEGGVYYIRQVGDCVWWFGTEIKEIEFGRSAQRGFANVASGRVSGTRIDLQFADVPLGNVLGGGGLTYVYDAEHRQLLLAEQRGDWIPFGGRVLTRIEPTASPEATPIS